jgi:hypothetical protein
MRKYYFGKTSFRSGVGVWTIVFLIFSVLSSCNYLKDQTKESGEDFVIARVKDNVLSKPDLPHNLQNIKGTDSALLSIYRDKWIKKQLLLQVAQENAETDPEIERMVADYRNALIVGKFREQYIDKHLDSIVTMEEVRAFYEADSTAFIVAGDLINATFIKVPSGVPELKKVKELINNNDTLALQSFAIRFAKTFFINEWVELHEIFREPAFQFTEKKENVKAGSYIEKTDAEYNYFLKVNSVVKAGEKYPLESRKEMIENLILNKRKLKLVNSLEQKLYFEAKKQGEIEIFK